MSRRTFLENMRHEVRKWDVSDPDSPRSNSGADAAPHAPAQQRTASSDMHSSPAHPLSAPPQATATPAAPNTFSGTESLSTRATPSVLTSTLGSGGYPLPENTLQTTHMTEFTVVSATTIATPRTSSPPPQTPVAVVEVSEEDFPAAGSAARPSKEKSRPVLSPDVLHLDAAAEQPFSADSPASWKAQRSSGNTGSHARRSSQSNSGVPEVLVTPRTANRRRSSVPHAGSTTVAPPRSVSIVTPNSMHRKQQQQQQQQQHQQRHSIGNGNAAGVTSAAQSRSRDRAGSITRMEASLVALQVELATEKRNNIEAEQHIMTLNTEVEKLRLDNARLSREVAEAVTHAASTTPRSSAQLKKADGAGASASASNMSAAPALAVGDAAVASARIEALEARLSELSRNLETKQRELDTKDERIRLLEHKLADTLLLQTGVHYMAVPAPYTNPLQTSGAPQAPYYYHRTASGSNNASQSGHSSASPAGVSGTAAPPRRLWQAEAPDHYAVTAVGPKIGAIRPVTPSSTGVHSNETSTNARPTSAVRRRSPVGHTGGPADNLHQLSPVPRREPELEPRSRTPPPSLVKAAEEPAAAETGPVNPSSQPPGVAVRSGSVRRPAPVRPSSARRGSARRKVSTGSRASSVEKASAATTTAAASAGALRRVSNSEKVRKRADSTAAHDDAATTTSAVASRGPTSASASPHFRPSSAGLSARRPSANRRVSAASTATRATETGGFQRSNSRRGSAAVRTAGHGTTAEAAAAAPSSPTHVGHPAHVYVSGSGAAAGGNTTSSAASVYARSQRALSTYRDARAPSATRSVAQRSVRSSTSTRTRPQIAFTTDGETSTMKGTTTTVMFRTRESRAGNASISSQNNSSSEAAAPLVAPTGGLTAADNFAVESSAKI